MGVGDSTLLPENCDKDKQEIGDKLFESVTVLYPDDADKITGMLMEMDSGDLKKLLSHRTELENKIKEAAEFLEETDREQDLGTTDITIDDELQSIGDGLHDIIMKIYPTSADKITGMLLEMGTENIKQLMKNESALKTHIDEAVVILSKLPENIQPLTESSKVSENPQLRFNSDAESAALELANMPEVDQKQVLGETLYPTVEKWHPDQADKVTGMLLDMDTRSLLQLLQNQELLKQKAKLAADVLENGKDPETSAKEKTIVAVASDEDEKMLLGENLYHVIEELFPDNAAKITGMLLEMNNEEIKEMLNNKGVLQMKATTAYETLNE